MPHKGQTYAKRRAFLQSLKMYELSDSEQEVIEETAREIFPTITKPYEEAICHVKAARKAKVQRGSNASR